MKRAADDTPLEDASHVKQQKTEVKSIDDIMSQITATNRQLTDLRKQLREHPGYAEHQFTKIFAPNLRRKLPFWLFNELVTLPYHKGDKSHLLALTTNYEEGARHIKDSIYRNIWSCEIRFASDANSTSFQVDPEAAVGSDNGGFESLEADMKVVSIQELWETALNANDNDRKKALACVAWHAYAAFNYDEPDMTILDAWDSKWSVALESDDDSDEGEEREEEEEEEEEEK